MIHPHWRILGSGGLMLLLTVMMVVLPADAQQERKGGNRARKGGHGPTQFHTDVPAHPIDFVLGRPTKDSITLSVLAYQDLEGFVAYGTEKGDYTGETPKQRFRKGQPVEVRMSSLQPNTRYYYQFRSRASGTGEFSGGGESTFHTARPPGSTFTFTVTADSHLDENTDCALYQRTLANAHADAPDFHVDLGDTFMTEKYASRTEAARQYLAQRFYFGQLSAAAPLFLVLGNHDGETPRGPGSEADSLAVWSNLIRKQYFPNPVPDGFYTGNSTKHPQAGLLQDYYAWEWGDALFIVLDPFRFTQRQQGASDNWSWTLGQEQYQWLKHTLEDSRARFKFVFLHNLVGGADPQGRGGAAAAPFYEWGGHNADGGDGFSQNRPGWPVPIHQLLVQNKVAIVFHGHDHFFAKQNRDGIVYQCVPQPGNRGNGAAPRSAIEYGYVSGVILGSPGYVRIAVAPDKVTAELVRSYLPPDESEGRKNHQVVYTYTIPDPGRATDSRHGNSQGPESPKE